MSGPTRVRRRRSGGRLLGIRHGAGRGARALRRRAGAVELTRLRAGERIAAVSALLLLAFTFLDWFNVKAELGRGLFGAVASASGGGAWVALGVIPVVLAIAIAAALAAAALRLAGGGPDSPVPANAVVAVLGGLATLLVLFRIVDPPGLSDVPGLAVDVSPAIGIFLALLAALGVAYGGYRGMCEAGASFASIAERLATPPRPRRSRGRPASRRRSRSSSG